MAKGYVSDAKIYPSQSHGQMSILDMLRHFEEKGTMRISDLHLKIGLPPLFRIDGKLVRLKGPPLTHELVEQLIYPLITDKNLAKFQDAYSIDSSYQVGSIQVRINVFREGRQSEIVKSQLSLGLKYIISQKLIPSKNGTGRIVAMEILNNDYACANLIRTGKLEQIYTQMQTKTQNRADQKMMTLERHLAILVRNGSIDRDEAHRWANNVKAFDDEIKQNN
jgi:Tfp pilus assembly pilus retraction ATPase PilT